MTRQQVGLDYIGDVSEVSALLAVPKNNGSLHSDHGGNKTREHARILRPWILKRAENIEIPEPNSFQTIKISAHPAIILADILHQPIWRNCVSRHALLFG